MGNSSSGQRPADYLLSEFKKKGEVRCLNLLISSLVSSQRGK